MRLNCLLKDILISLRNIVSMYAHFKSCINLPSTDWGINCGGFLGKYLPGHCVQWEISWPPALKNKWEVLIDSNWGFFFFLLLLFLNKMWLWFRRWERQQYLQAVTWKWRLELINFSVFSSRLLLKLNFWAHIYWNVLLKYYFDVQV